MITEITKINIRYYPSTTTQKVVRYILKSASIDPWIQQAKTKTRHRYIFEQRKKKGKRKKKLKYGKEEKKR